MQSSVYIKFFELLDQIVNEERPVNQKISSLLSQATEDDRSNLEEFWTWDDV